MKARVASQEDKEYLAEVLFYLRQPSTGSVDGDVLQLASSIEEYVSRILHHTACLLSYRLVVALGLKSNLAEYKVPPEDIPKIVEKAIGSKDDPTFADVVGLLQGLYPA